MKTVIPQNIIDRMRPEDRAHLGKAGRTTTELVQADRQRREKELHHDIVRYLNILGIPFCHARMDKKSGITVGWPDFSFPYKGVFVAWEAKTITSLSPAQFSVRDAILKHGGQYKVIRELSEAKNHLRAIDAELKDTPVIVGRNNG